VTKVKNNQHETHPEKKWNRNTVISKYLSIITLNVNRINSPIKRHRFSDCIKIRSSNFFSTRNTSHKQTHTKATYKRLEKVILGMWSSKAGRSRYFYIKSKGFMHMQRPVRRDK
jgi:hypothetical protein